MNSTCEKLMRALDAPGDALGMISLRLLLAWEFFESGWEKFRGQNWFAEIAERFPFPFDRLPADLSWAFATGFELAGAVALLVGLGTRFFAAALMVLTTVAMFAVHWPEQWSTLAELMRGYVFTDRGYGNFKLPVIFLAMLLPLVLRGPGGFSLDALLRKRCARGR